MTDKNLLVGGGALQTRQPLPQPVTLSALSYPPVPIETTLWTHSLGPGHHAMRASLTRDVGGRIDSTVQRLDLRNPSKVARQMARRALYALLPS